MTEERIISRKNPLIQQIRRLFSSRKERESTGLFAADGIKLLAEAVRYGSGLNTVVMSDGLTLPFSIPEGVRRVRVPGEIMSYISPMEAPQGAIFLCGYPEEPRLTPLPGMLLLDGIQDPGNLGTILRTADAMGVPAVLLEGCADPYNPKTVRASMGAIFRMPIYRAQWSELLPELRNRGIPVAVTALCDSSVDIRLADLRGAAVVIGSEGSGVRKQILGDADLRVIIPMNAHCESLNAAAAAAIVLWQMNTL